MDQGYVGAASGVAWWGYQAVQPRHGGQQPLQMITPPSYGLGPLLLPIKRVTLLRSARRQKTFLEEDNSYYKYIGIARYVIITGST